MSGELEGSTLGSSSRDGDRGSRGQRRTPSSGGFLLDSPFLPRSKTLRTSHYRARRSEPEQREKRAAPEPEVTVPKKKSRFPWSRHKRSTGSSSLSATPSSSATPQEVPLDSPDVQQLEEPHERHATADTNEPAAGLDRDSLQIVNLALNLSESRKRNSIGRSASTRLPGGKLGAYGDIRTPAPMGSVGHHPSQNRRTFTTPYDSLRPSGLQHQQVAEEHPAISSILNPGDAGAVPFKASDSTLARAESARRHFELFAEYLRLLPSLPPLKIRKSHTSGLTSGPHDDPYTSRAYNPLQSIRNRKIRLREKCPIDTEGEGWNDIEKVHRWVDDVEDQSSHQNRTSLACLDLPPFHREEQDPPGVADNPNLLTVSPPSSLRRVSRISSGKSPRPRLDWITSPAELLADVAWVESGQNKSKIIDKDGIPIYPDPELIAGKTSIDTPSSRMPRHLTKDRPVDQRVPSTPTDHHDSMDIDSKMASRGRQRRRLSSPSSALSTAGRDSKHKSRMRSTSSSTTASTSEDYTGSRSNVRIGREKSPEPHVPGRLNPHLSRGKRPNEYREESVNITPSHGNGLTPYQTKKAGAHHPKGSLSSASIDDQYSPRMSLDAPDSPAANSPSQAGYFPSITVNLSPPSTRSPSPTKKPFSRMKTPRHERSKSKLKKDARDHADDSSLHSEALGKRGHQSHPSVSDRPGRLEPSPLPDRVSTSYQEGQLSDEPYNSKTQKGPKFRGFLKGSGKIAGIVGNEVSRVGDRILKKDPHSHFYKSSAVGSLDSNDSDMDDAEEARSESKPGPIPSLQRLPTYPDNSSRFSGRNVEKGTMKSSIPSLPTFTSSHRQDEDDNQVGESGFDTPYERGSSPRTYGARATQNNIPSVSDSRRGKFGTHLPVSSPERGFAFSSSPSPGREKPRVGQIKDASVPFSLTRPPVTGLAQAKASPGPSREGGQRMSEASRSWSISDRSLTALAETGIPEKREVERTRTLLLASGIKAREINRRAESNRDPPEFLRSSVGLDEPVPRVTRLYEFDVAAQNLMQGFEKSHYLFQQSIDRFPAATSSPLRSQLNSLETLANQKLSPRVRAIGDDAEDLSVQLHTTSTLAVKQLSDALDRGMRKRHRRLRWIRRAGFSVLEWALVGVLWWVWLIVMVFKLFRGVIRGAVSGVRWILWL